jgi:hypothetical protein
VSLPYQDWVPDLAQKHCTRLETPARDQHPSFLRKFVTYRSKMSYNIAPDLGLAPGITQNY